MVWPLVSTALITIWLCIGMFLYQSKVICIGPVWNYWISKWLGIDHPSYQALLKGEDEIDLAILNKSLLAEFLIETLPQLIIQSVNTVFINDVNAVFLFSVILSSYDTINGLWKYGYYILYLGKSFSEVPHEIEMFGGFIKSSYDPQNPNQPSNPHHEYELKAWKLILESGYDHHYY